jgi:hypothetical protein
MNAAFIIVLQVLQRGTGMCEISRRHHYVGSPVRRQPAAKSMRTYRVLQYIRTPGNKRSLFSALLLVAACCKVNACMQTAATSVAFFSRLCWQPAAGCSHAGAAHEVTLYDSVALAVLRKFNACS